MHRLSAVIPLLPIASSAASGYPLLEGEFEALYLADSTGICIVRDMPGDLLPEGIDSLFVLPPASFVENPEMRLVGVTGERRFDLGPLEFAGIYNSPKSDWWYDDASGAVLVYSQMPFSAFCFTCSYAPGVYPDVLVLVSSREEDPSEDRLEMATALLDEGRLAEAYSELIEIFYPGHYYSDAEMAVSFLEKGHELALDAWADGDGERACSLMTEAFEIAGSIHPLPVTDSRAAGDSVQMEGFITTGELVEIENDRGFFLAESGRLSAALPPLEWVVENDPGRAVARLNLADALWGLGRTGDAIPHYEEYLMLLAEMDCLDRAPDRAFERTGFIRPE